MTRFRELLPLAILIGALLGLGSRLADLQENALNWFGSLAAPWILASFTLGAMSIELRRAAALASSAMLVGVAGYYGWMRLFEGGVNLSYFFSVTTVWIVLAPVAGLLFGLAGAAWRAPGRHWVVPAISVALTSGAVAGESAFMTMTSRGLTGGGIAVLGGFIGVGLALPGALLCDGRCRLAGYALALCVVLVGLAAVPVVRLLVSLLD